MPFFNALASETKHFMTGRIGSCSGKSKQQKKLTKLFPPQCNLKGSLHFDSHEKVFFCWIMNPTTVIFPAQWNNPTKLLPSKFSSIKI